MNSLIFLYQWRRYLRRFFLLITGLFFTLTFSACGGNNAANATNVGAGNGRGGNFTSEITNISFDTNAIDVSAAQSITTTITSAASVTNVDYIFSHTGAGGGYSLEKKGVVPIANQFVVATNAYTPDGMWILDNIVISTATHIYTYYTCNGGQLTYCWQVTDSAQNPITINTSTDSGITYPSSTISNAAVDNTPPTINSVAVSGTKTGAGGTKFKTGDIVTVDVDVVDLQRGLVQNGLTAYLYPRTASIVLNEPDYLVYPSLGGTSTFALQSGSTYRGYITIGDTQNVYPAELYLYVYAEDLGGPGNFVQLYRGGLANYTQRINVTNTDSQIPQVDVPLEYSWPPVTISGSFTPSTSGAPVDNSFTITPNQLKVHTYSVLNGVNYGFSNGSSSLAGMVFSLFYSNGTPVLANGTGGVLAGSPLDVIINAGTTRSGFYPAPVGFTASGNDTVYVLSYCNGNCAGGTVKHRLYSP